MKRMKTALIILVIPFFLSCVKEESIKNGAYNDWVIESLNNDYLVQLPPYFIGDGFTDSRFYKENPSEDIRIFYECIGGRLDCVGDTIRAPYPESITILPFFASSSFIWLKNRDYFYNDDSIPIVMFYQADTFKNEDKNIYWIYGQLYWKESDYYISLTRFQYEVVKQDSFKMIIKTIKKK
jgi:hypothetical protein